MSEVVVAIDGSEHSYPVVDAAVKLARQTGSRIVLVHVIPRLSVPEEFMEFVKTEKIREPPRVHLSEDNRRADTKALRREDREGGREVRGAPEAWRPSTGDPRGR